MPISNNLIVNYKLSAENAAQINRRRTNSQSIAERIKEKIWPTGAQAHIGNEAREGQILPMVIVGIWSDTCVNGQVFLDGCDQFWVTSAPQGNEPGNWNYFMCD
jgi:hypothetical protein